MFTVLKIKRTIALLLCGCALFCAQQSVAQITELCSGSSRCAAPSPVIAGVDTQVRVTWRGLAMVERATTLVSDSGLLFFDGTPPQNINVALRINLQPNPVGAPVQILQGETLRVPGQLSLQAQRAGRTELNYRRSFIYQGQLVSAVISIPIQARTPPIDPSLTRDPDASSQTALAITRLTLKFDSGEVIKTVDANSDLAIQALINYQQSGLLSAAWEVARDDSGIYRPIKQVRQFLGAGKFVTLSSPLLPTLTPGRYTVRLNIRSPNTDPTLLPSLTYVVQQVVTTKQEKPTAINVQQLEILSPLDGEVFTRDRSIEWQAVAGSSSYKVEFFSADNLNFPIGGLLVKNTQTLAELPASTWDKLPNGKPILYQVKAIDPDGKTLAVSQKNRLTIKK